MSLFHLPRFHNGTHFSCGDKQDDKQCSCDEIGSGTCDSSCEDLVDIQCIVPEFTRYKTSRKCRLDSRRCEESNGQFFDETTGRCNVCDRGREIDGNYRPIINYRLITKEQWEYGEQNPYTYSYPDGPAHDYVGHRPSNCK